MKSISSIVLILLVLSAVGVFSEQNANAGGRFRHRDAHRFSDVNSNITVTGTKYHATLTGADSQTAASGFSESVIVSITNATTNTITTNTFFIVFVKNLTLADGTVVTFEQNGNSIGIGTVEDGRVCLRLSSKKGDTVPSVSPNDTITMFVSGTTSTVEATGTFGAATTITGDWGC